MEARMQCLVSGAARALRRPPAFRALAVLAALVALVAAGCGQGKLILRIDLLSFLSPGETAGGYGPIPPGIGDSVTVVADRAINLVPGLQDVSVVDHVDLEVVGEFRNQSGSGSGAVRVYLSDSATDPFTTAPIVVPVTLNGAATDTVSVDVLGDPRIAQLFTSKELRLGLRVALAADPGPDPVQGTFVLTRLRAIVTAGQAIF
jgi:hypothetical protein